jgi:hypothetical protein
VSLYSNYGTEYFDWIIPLPEDASRKNQNAFRKLFITNKKNRKKEGMMWIRGPKKSSGVIKFHP